MGAFHRRQRGCAIRCWPGRLVWCQRPRLTGPNLKPFGAARRFALRSATQLLYGLCRAQIVT